MKLNNNEYVEFRGIKINNISYPKILHSISNNIEKTGYVCLTCGSSVISSTRDEKFRAAINKSLISIADGMPLAWYGKLLGCRNIERISGTELMKRLLEEENGFKHFLLGDTEETINKLIYKATDKNNKISINGFSPPFKKEFNDEDNALMLDRIKQEDPDLIWVSFGGGKQEKWMHQNFHKLDRGVMIGVGAAFRFYTGEIKTPPKIFQTLGLQWLFRMAGDPVTFGPGYMSWLPEFIIRFPFELIAARRIKAQNRRSAKTPAGKKNPPKSKLAVK